MRNLNFQHASFSSDIYAGQIPRLESEETTHFSIADEDGNAVAITTTINGSSGSQVVVAGEGILLYNAMVDFSVKPGTPHMSGMTGGGATSTETADQMLTLIQQTTIQPAGQLL